jgi:alpha-L-rhamnosidase
MKINSQLLPALIVLSLFLTCACGTDTDNQTLTPVHLSCEYLNNPLGIESQAPRFSWQLVSEIQGDFQTAYRVIVADTEEAAKEGTGNVWDSQKAQTNQNMNVVYQGGDLAQKTRYWWAVKVWDKEGEEQAWSEPGWFETGIWEEDGWKDAKWIGLKEDNRSDAHNRRPLQIRSMDTPRMERSHASPVMRKEFSIKKKIKQARIYFAGLGYSELYVNGERVGDAVLNPGQTSYDKRAYYDVYDIGDLLKRESNVIGAMLGNGFYGQSMAFGVKFLNYGVPALKCLVCMEYEDGTLEELVSDGSWLSSTGPVVFDNVYAGETYDAREEIAGWNQVNCDFEGWQEAKELTDVDVPGLTAQLIPPIRKIQTLDAVEFYETSQDSYIFDFGQNIAGWARIHVNESSGQEISIRYSEILSPDGQELETATTGGHATGFDQIDQYLCKGEGEEVWEPRFTYHGFRYAEVKGITDPSLASVKAILVHSDVKRAGHFECSDPLLNRIYTTSLWTIVDNLHSVPEDCPHREKCAWLGDAHASVEVMNYNYDMSRLWIKFMKDVETNLGTGDHTYEKIPATAGIPTNIAVGRRVCQEARPDWGAAILLVPWSNFLYYGNERILEENYEHMVRWMDYLRAYLKDHILYQGYGDWCPPGGNRGAKEKVEVELTSTAFYYHSLELMSKISTLMGEEEKASAYLEEAVLIRKAFNDKFLNEETYSYGTQTGTAVALDMGLVPADLEVQVVDALVKLELLEKYQGHFNTGIHGAKRLYDQLSIHGYEEELFAMIRKKEFPSYHYLFENGFTTWPESFLDYETSEDAIRSGSHNHPMQAGFAMWFHRHLGGIQGDENHPGFSKFLIKPFGYNQLEYVNSSFESMYGTMVSNWKSTDGRFVLDVEIPANTSSTVFIPAASEGDITLPPGVEAVEFIHGMLRVEVPSGSYSFSSNL